MAAEQMSGKAATQERILAAATELFLEQGYERTTVAEVAQRAGVSRATVFWHFSDKAGLFREAFNRLVEPFRVSLERDFAELPPAKRLDELIALYRSFAGQQRAALEGFVRWAIEAQHFRESMITLAPPEHDPKALAVGLIVLLDGDLLLSFFDTSGPRAEERRASIETIAALIPRREV